MRISDWSSDVCSSDLFADIELVKGLNFRSTFGLRYENYNGVSIGYPNPERSEGSFTNNTLREYQGYNYEWTWLNSASYKNTFSDDQELTGRVGTRAKGNSTVRKKRGSSGKFRGEPG